MRHPARGAERKGSPLHWAEVFSPRLACCPLLARQTSHQTCWHLPWLPCDRDDCHVLLGSHCQRPHAHAGWLPMPQHSGCWEGPPLAGNVSLAHRQQLTALCCRRPGAPAVLISIIQAPCVSHSPPPLGFLLPVNKHVSLCFLHGGLCREQFYPQTDHCWGLIFLSAGFHLQYDERFFLPFTYLF